MPLQVLTHDRKAIARNNANSHQRQVIAWMRGVRGCIRSESIKRTRQAFFFRLHARLASLRSSLYHSTTLAIAMHTSH